MDWRHVVIVGLAYLLIPLAGFIGIERVHGWLQRLTIRLYGDDAVQS